MHPFSAGSADGMKKHQVFEKADEIPCDSSLVLLLRFLTFHHQWVKVRK